MILFYNQDVTFSLKSKNLVKRWIRDVLASHHLQAGDINYIFSNDAYILQVNRQFLSHDFYTDVITFDTSDYSEPFSHASRRRRIDGDIFISLDTVHLNALEYGTDFSSELYRVIIHGILHLVGYDDHSEEDIRQMRSQEESALALRPSTGEQLPVQHYRYVPLS